MNTNIVPLTSSSPEVRGSTVINGVRWLQAGVFSVLMILGAHSSPTSANTHLRYSPTEVTSSAPKGHLDGSFGLTPGSALLEIRKISGATWEEMSELFHVTPRSLHHWVNGKQLTPSNERLVYQMLAAFRSINSGVVSEVRSRIFAPRSDGMSLFEHLKAQNFDQALLGKEEAPTSMRKYVPLNASAMKGRLPIPVAVALAGEDGPPIALTERYVRKSIRRPA